MNNNTDASTTKVASATSSKEAAVTQFVRVGSGTDVYQVDAFPPFPQSAESPQTQAERLFYLIPAKFSDLDTSFAELPEVSPDCFPNWVGNMASEVAANTQTPVGMALMLALSMMATCLQRKIEVEGITAGHREPVSIWTCSVLPPGNNKSAVFNLMKAPLDNWVEEENNRTESERIKKFAEIDIAAKRIDKLKRECGELESGDSFLTDRLAEIEKLERLRKYPPVELRLCTDDSTCEGVRDMLVEQGGRAAILSDEGGAFDTLTGLYNNGNANIDVLLKGFSGGSISVTRTNKTYTVKDVVVSLGLTVQPTTLQNLQPGKGTKGSLRGRGFTGRAFFYVPKSLVGQRTVDGRKAIQQATIDAYNTGIKKMLMLVDNRSDDGAICKYVYKLSDGAKELYRRFWQEVEARHGCSVDGSSDERDLTPIQDFTTKLQGSVLRIAGLFHHAEYFGAARDTEIAAETMSNAIKVVKTLIPHAQEAYAMMGDDTAPKDKHAAEVYKWIKGKAVVEFRESDLKTTEQLKPTFAKMPAKELERVLSVLERNGVISESVKVETNGRPFSARLVNPLCNAQEPISTPKHPKNGN
ncbi:MAG: hypothetical protein QG574_3738 [Cyanobacteriota bacterium erpe_2018_sw_21hr_WHONDRS-SW48-000092_B_bin.40]|nr:hypothetical protein [Cyanobacteriota bacterium erpe_2018_sw_21hr_WHONDRS-SW48-000092_B_bin.40]